MSKVITIEEIIKKVGTDEESAMSGTAVSKKLGYSKSNKNVNQLLNETASDPKNKFGLKTKKTRGFFVYWIGEKVESSDSKEETASITKEEVSDPAFGASDPTTPESDSEFDRGIRDQLNIVADNMEIQIPINKHGYSVDVNYDHGGYDIVDPTGKSFHLNQSERLLVLNLDNKYRFIVDKPEDVIRALAIYSQDKGIRNYVVTSMETSSPIMQQDLKTSMNFILMFLKVQKHNKAG